MFPRQLKPPPKVKPPVVKYYKTPDESKDTVTLKGSDVQGLNGDDFESAVREEMKRLEEHLKSEYGTNRTNIGNDHQNPGPKIASDQVNPLIDRR